MKNGQIARSKTKAGRVPLNMRVTPETRAAIEKAAEGSGRSLSAEVEFRVEDYDRAMRAYAVATSDPFVQRVALKIADAAEFLDTLFASGSDEPKAKIRTSKRLDPSYCDKCHRHQQNYGISDERELSPEDARKEYILDAARSILSRFSLDGRVDKGENTEILLEGTASMYAGQEIAEAMRPIVDQIAHHEEWKEIYEKMAEQVEDKQPSDESNRYSTLNRKLARNHAEAAERLRAQLPDLGTVKPAQEEASPRKRPKRQRKPTG